MFSPLPTPEEMSVWDQKAIKLGIPGFTLMESASREALSVLLEQYGDVTGATAFIVAGKGNNGGDAFALARHLADLAVDVTVFYTQPKKLYRGEAKSNLQLCKKLGIPLKAIRYFKSRELLQPDILVDGLLGTGFSGSLRNEALELVQRMNEVGKGAFVLALDVPSGLNASTGHAQPHAVFADITATFEAAKIGLMMPGAQQYTGKVFVCPIGIPVQIKDRFAPFGWLMNDSLLHDIPSFTPAMHKGTAGHVLIIGGSKGLTGAPHLAALGALRAGAGRVTLACPAGLEETVRHSTPEIMTLPVGTGMEWTAESAQTIIEQLHRFSSVVLGPGLGRGRKTVDFLKKVVASCSLPLVLDADALYLMAKDAVFFKALPDTAILTPHPGEMAALVGKKISDIQDDRLHAAKEFAAQTKATIVLKGAGTIVATQKRLCLSSLSARCLAVAGSGDVLAGVIGSLLAAGLPPFHAACLSVHWHGTAGLLLETEFPVRGNLASEIASALPHVLKGVGTC